MKRFLLILASILMLGTLWGCSAPQHTDIAVTTLPVYEFTTRLCQGTDLTVTRLVTENVSCLHDYTLQVSQMRAIESAKAIVISGGGLEDFLHDALHGSDAVIEAAHGIELLCPTVGHDHHHDNHHHHHDTDPHLWLSPIRAKEMAQNICNGLCVQFPQHADTFRQNLTPLLHDLDALQAYANTQLQHLAHRDLITFHDGFAYMAEAFDLAILHAVEEESGSEASAAELIELIGMVEQHQLPAIFIEANGSDAAAKIIAAETGVKLFSLDMAMSGDSYFDAMYHNIDTIKEALG
jgi:ABC-type Zn uptake system ZnuABC Zn-binding protein ZnuA